MDDDVDMDAPLISTLPEEKTPPPSRRKADSTRKKKAKQPVQTLPLLSWRKSGGQTSDVELGEEGEPEDEEDQLIDDEDDVATPSNTPASVAGKSSDAVPKKKAAAKRKARKEPGMEEEGGKKRTKKDSSLSSKPQKPSGSDSLDDGTDMGTGATTPSIRIVEDEPQEISSVSKPAKKKTTPRKTATKAAKGKPSGLKMVIPALSAIAVDDTASVMSEGGISGTAASSPAAGNFEKSQPASPEAEQVAPSSPTTIPAPLAEETNLENIPLPVYPLPSKPFPVQPPPKIPTGFAPPLPLDKSGKKVRHWRLANREIRGIAGGRWFSRSWVGERDSEYASSVAAKESEKANGLSHPSKQSSASASMPSLARGTGKKAKGASSLTASAAPSRDPSVVPQEISAGASVNTQIPIATSVVRAPTKMRIQQLPEDPPSDAAMDTDPIPAPPFEA